MQFVKVKFSLYKPWRPLGLREVEAPTFSDIRLIDGGKVVSPTRRPLFTPQELYNLYKEIYQREQRGRGVKLTNST
jgi:hypothetical protein